MNIIEYEEKYKKQVIAFILAIQRVEFGLLIDLKDQPDLLDIQKNYQQRGNFWLAVEKEVVIGTIALKKLKNNNGSLKKMFVASDFRGEAQVGKQLLMTLFNYAEKNGINPIYLGTNSKFQAAQRFYKKHQFKEIDLMDMPQDFPILEVDDIFLMRSN